MDSIKVDVEFNKIIGKENLFTENEADKLIQSLSSKYIDDIDCIINKILYFTKVV